MKYAIIKNGIVENVIIADDLETAALFGNAILLDDNALVAIGDLYDGYTFTRVERAPIAE